MNQVITDTRVISPTVTAIQQEAHRNEIFGAICYNFALRQRTKETLTLKALRARMEKEGANFRREDYEHALKFLAKLGLGVLKHDNKGRISALAQIKVTLQSIGQASGMKTTQLKTFSKHRTFQKLQEQISTKQRYVVNLSIKLNDNALTMPGPLELTPEELGEFLIEFSEMTKRVKQ